MSSNPIPGTSSLHRGVVVVLYLEKIVVVVVEWLNSTFGVPQPKPRFAVL